MTDHKKVAIITPFLANGGLEKVTIVGAKELSKEFDVTLIVMDSFHVDYAYSGKMIDLNVSLMDRGLFKRLYNIVSSTLKLRKLKKAHGFEVVISHGELANLPNVFSGGKKNILVVHGDRFADVAQEDIQSRLVNKVIKYVYSSKSVSKVVTVSEGIRESLIKNLGMKDQDIITIYNPFNINEIKTLANESLKEYSDLFSHDVLIVVGRLSMLKGQWYLLRIFRELKKSKLALKIVILGDGEMKEQLIELSDNLGLKTYTVWNEEQFNDSFDVYFMGFQKNPFKFIKASKLFMLTSLLEGFGNVIVEAMACGTPVVSTDCRFGPREIIYPELKKDIAVNKPSYDGFGTLMPIFQNEFVGAGQKLDEKEFLWVDALQVLVNDDKKMTEYTKLGLKRAEDFNLNIIMLEWKNLIDTLINE